MLTAAASHLVASTFTLGLFHTDCSFADYFKADEVLVGWFIVGVDYLISPDNYLMRFNWSVNRMTRKNWVVGLPVGLVVELTPELTFEGRFAARCSGYVIFARPS